MKWGDFSGIFVWRVGLSPGEWLLCSFAFLMIFFLFSLRQHVTSLRYSSPITSPYIRVQSMQSLARGSGPKPAVENTEDNGYGGGDPTIGFFAARVVGLKGSTPHRKPSLEKSRKCKTLDEQTHVECVYQTLIFMKKMTSPTRYWVKQPPRHSRKCFGQLVLPLS